MQNILSDYNISMLPALYGLLGTAGLEESGILYFHRSPYLNLRGSGVMIGVIDTGIDYRHQAFTYEDRTTKIYSIWDQTIRDGESPEGFIYGTEYTSEQINRALAAENSLAVVPSQDENGHGSMVYRTLAQTDTEFYIVKVLNESNQGNSLTLCEALKWLLNIEVKLIVICISTNNLEMGQEYEKLINKLSIQGKILFASWTNNGRDTLSYPAILKNVISVGRKKMDSKFIECDWKNNIQCLINIDISYIWIPEKGFRSFGGNSQATADLVAMVCKRIGYVRDIKEMRKRIDELDYNYYRIYRDYECETDQRLLSIIEKYSKTFTAESAMWEIFPTIEELSDFLEEICTIFEINKYTVIFKRSMFVSIKKFSNTINIIKNGEKKYEN